LVFAFQQHRFWQGGKEQVEKLAPGFGIQIVANEVYEKEATGLDRCGDPS